MTRVPGRVYLTPKDPDDWLSQMAAVLPKIHSAELEAPKYESWLDLEALKVPVWSENPRAWEQAIELARGNEASCEPRFIHRDFQHFNILWQRGKLTGVVDWLHASIGSPDIDVAHCRLNLAALFSADWAERFRIAYEAEAGRSVDPWWDAVGLLTYLPGWKSSLQLQAGSQKRVDRDGMHWRLEELLEIALRRL
jgi:aminoglycoside phosphotransferase (APT) family kinase protein